MPLGRVGACTPQGGRVVSVPLPPTFLPRPVGLALPLPPPPPIPAPTSHLPFPTRVSRGFILEELRFDPETGLITSSLACRAPTREERQRLLHDPAACQPDEPTLYELGAPPIVAVSCCWGWLTKVALLAGSRGPVTAPVACGSLGA